jgi:hypothetical protein
MCTLHLDDCRQNRYTLPTLRSTSHLQPKIAQLVTYLYACPQLKQCYDTTQYHFLIKMDLGFRVYGYFGFVWGFVELFCMVSVIRVFDFVNNLQFQVFGF